MYWMDMTGAFQHKIMTRTDTAPLSWNQMFKKRERIFAATNGSPNSTAVALSLQVCVAAATGTPRTQECFFLYRRIKPNRESTHNSQIKT